MSAASRPRAPEVLQTSEMDCGPAALASLLGMFGLGVDLGALREVCATDVDGTSIDVLEEVAVGLGLDAEQVVVPWEQVRAVPQLYLPALLVTRTPTGLAHVVCAWRARRGRVDVVDPAVGRRRVRWEALAEEAFVHELEAPRQAWDGYALSEDAAAALVARLRASGISESQARDRVAAAQCGGGLEDGVGDLLAGLDGAGSGEEGVAPAVSPSATDGMVRVRGAILVRARGTRGEAHQAPATLRRVLAGATEDPLPALARLVGLRRRGSLPAALTAALAAAAGVAEVLAAREVLESGFGGDRLVGLAAALGVAILASAAFALQVSAIGRRVEGEMLEALFERAGRFGEVFSRTRPAGDLAERTHALRELREAIELAGLGIQRSLELVLACAAIVVVAPAAWPAAAALLGIGALAPWSIVRTLREADLRSRALGGVLAQLLTDALGGMWAVRAHRGGAVVRAWQAPLIAHWKRASASLATRNALAAGLLSGPALLIAVVAAALAAGSGAGSASAFIVLALGFTAAASIGDVTIATRRLVSLRSVIARLLDALNAPLLDPAPLAPSAGAAPGVAIAIGGVDVVLGGNPVLSGVDLGIAPGEHVAVVGVSGAGKSTLIALLGGWLTPASGSLLVDGDPLAAAALAELRAAVAWSDPGARLRDVSPLENAADGSAADAPRAAERIAAVGLPPDLLGGGGVGEAGGRLDGPDAQRLRLARALGRPNARLVLLDEALRGLPRGERRQLLAHLRGVWREATLLHVTHDPEEALGFDRVLVVADGRLAEDGAPGELAARPDSLLRGLLDAHATVERRLADPARWRPLADPPGRQAPESGAALDESAAPAAGFPHRPPAQVTLLALVSLAAAFAATGLLFLAAIRLGNGLSGPDPGDLGWLPGSLALLLAAALVSALGLLADGRLMLRVGGYLRRRALAASLAGDPERRRGEGIGIRLGRVLDLEALERAAQGTGTVLAVGAAELIGAAVALTITVSALALAPLALALAACVALTLAVTRATREENRRRQDLGARLLDLLLGYRAATIFASPDADAAHRSGMVRLRGAERRGDIGRAALVTSIPRIGALAVVGVLALDPPATPGAVAAALGATLLALTGLERVALALADLAIAAAAWQEARPLLELEDSTPGHPTPETDAGEPATRRRRGSEALLAVGSGSSPAATGGRAAFAPAPGEDVLFHQPLVANALLATDRWPPRDEDWEALAALLEPLALAGVVARMPNGIAQPLGETGWRLSEGERARFSLLRALLAAPTDLLADDTLAALDAHTAHRVLDHLEGLEASVTLLRRR